MLLSVFLIGSLRRFLAEGSMTVEEGAELLLA